MAAGVDEHLLGAVHDQRAVRQSGERVVQRLVAQLAGLLLDHPQRAGAAAGQDLDEHEREQSHDEPDHRGGWPGLRGGAARAARRADTGIQRPSASTEMRRLSRGAGATVPKRATACCPRSPRACGRRGRRRWGRGSRVSRRARGRAPRRRPPGRRPTSAGSAPRRTTRRSSRWRAGGGRSASSGRRRRRRPGRRPRTSGARGRAHDERAELARVTRVGEQLGELAEVQPRDGGLLQRFRHARAGDADRRQAVVGAGASRVERRAAPRA